MTDRLSGTFRGAPARLRSSWRLSRRQRAAVVAAAPLVVFGAASWWWGDVLLSLLVSCALTCAAGVVALAVWVLPRLDRVEDEQQELGRRVTSHTVFRREVHAATDEVARLSARVRFLEEMRLGEPQERQGKP